MLVPGVMAFRAGAVYFRVCSTFFRLLSCRTLLITIALARLMPELATESKVVT